MHVALLQWDMPGDCNFDEGVFVDGQHYPQEAIFGRTGAVVFVIDAQEDLQRDREALDRLRDAAVRVAHFCPGIPFEVFVHKVDGDLFQNPEHRADCLSGVQSHVAAELADARIAPGELKLAYQQTSIYDHSVFEAFSRVVQHLVCAKGVLDRCGIQAAHRHG